MQGVQEQSASTQGRSAPRWRDPELGAMLQRARLRLSVTAFSLAHAAWEMGVPLSCQEVTRIELGRRHPTPWHLHAWMEVLALSEIEREALILRWAKAPRWNEVTSMATWRQLLAEVGKPVPVTRQARSGRLHSKRRVEVGTAFKLRLTAEEDTLVRKAATLYGITMSDLIRDAVFDAVARRRKAKHRETIGPKVADHNVRLGLTPEASAVIKMIGHGLDLAPWVRLIVLDDLESGRAAKRYQTGDRANSVPATPQGEAEPAA